MYRRHYSLLFKAKIESKRCKESGDFGGQNFCRLIIDEKVVRELIPQFKAAGRKGSLSTRSTRWCTDSEKVARRGTGSAHAGLGSGLSQMRRKSQVRLCGEGVAATSLIDGSSSENETKITMRQI